MQQIEPTVALDEQELDEMELVADQAEAKLRTLELELSDDAEEWLAIVADVESM